MTIRKSPIIFDEVKMFPQARAAIKYLAANGHKLYFYNHYNEEKHRNDMEIDFLISNNSKLKYKLYPIEVKSGKKFSTNLLDTFRGKYRQRIGESYIIHPKNLSVKEGIVCIPPYMTMMLQGCGSQNYLQ